MQLLRVSLALALIRENWNKGIYYGGKIEIIDRIAHFLDTGEVLAAPVAKKKVSIVFDIHEDLKIETDIVCSESHRAFFRKQIGNSFSFNVTFQNWLKTNSGIMLGKYQ